MKSAFALPGEQRGLLIAAVLVVYVGASMALTATYPSWPASLPVYGAVLVALIMVCAGLYRDAFARQMQERRVTGEVLAGIAFIIPMAVLATVWVVSPLPMPHTQGIEAPGRAASFLLIVGFAVLEELYFRGVLFDFLASRWGLALAVVASSVLFGLGHAVPVMSAASLGFYTLMGLTLGLVRTWRRTMIAAMACHVAWNVSLFALGGY